MYYARVLYDLVQAGFSLNTLLDDRIPEALILRWHSLYIETMQLAEEQLQNQAFTQQAAQRRW